MADLAAFVSEDLCNVTRYTARGQRIGRLPRSLGASSTVPAQPGHRFDNPGLQIVRQRRTMWLFIPAIVRQMEHFKLLHLSLLLGSFVLAGSRIIMRPAVVESISCGSFQPLVPGTICVTSISCDILVRRPIRDYRNFYPDFNPS